MKKLFVLSLLVCMALAFALPQEAHCLERQNLYSLLKDAQEVKIYVAPVTDSSGAAGDMLSDLRENLEKELQSRKSIHFVMVPNAEDADLVIKCDVNERIWMAEDPVDDITGIAGIAIDAATSENYGRISVDIVVEKGEKKVVLKELRKLFRRNPVLWEREISADITQKIMPEEESKDLLKAHLAEIFIRKCFSKNSRV